MIAPNTCILHYTEFSHQTAPPPQKKKTGLDYLPDKSRTKCRVLSTKRAPVNKGFFPQQSAEPATTTDNIQISINGDRVREVRL